MAQSGSRNWTQATTDIILRAMRLVGIHEPDEANLLIYAKNALNSMIASWQTKGVCLWTVERNQQTFSAASEVTGTDSNIYTCILGHTSSSDDTPITGANYSTYWVQSGSTGGVWAADTAYTSPGDFAPGTDVIGVQNAYIRRSDSDHPVTIYDMTEYANLTNKHQEGRPVALFFEKKLTPKIFLWPIPDTTTDVLHYSKILKLQDFDSSDDNPDFPEQWIEAIVYGLAARFILEMPKGLTQGLSDYNKNMIRKDAVQLFKDAKNNNYEQTEDYFVTPFNRKV